MEWEMISRNPSKFERVFQQKIAKIIIFLVTHQRNPYKNWAFGGNNVFGTFFIVFRIRLTFLLYTSNARK